MSPSRVKLPTSVIAVCAGLPLGSARVGGMDSTASATVPVSIAKVETTPNPVTLGAGKEAQPQFRAWDSNNTLLKGLNPSWASPSTITATVSAIGEILALTEDNAQIAVTVGSHTASTAVAVSIAVPCLIADADVPWSSLNPTVAVVLDTSE